MKFCPQCKSDINEDELDGAVRLICSSTQCDYIYWNNPIPVIAGIVELDGKFVMAHNVTWPKGMFSVITGFLEQREDPAECIVRETKEELGLDVYEQKLVGVYGFDRMNQVIIAYHVKAKGKIVLNEELDDYKLVELNELKPWPFGTGLAIKDFLIMNNVEV
ncbi:MAG: NUDIX domain-containing protein [Pseudomonadales bacterium]|nr:NUDIX domain-containing protein [Pseudomonadales bacterium]